MIKPSPVLFENTVGKAQKPQASMVFGQNDRMAGSVPVFPKEGNFSAEIARLEDTEKSAQHLNALAGDTSAKNTDIGRGDEFGFFDFLDIVNPLQHIPLVSILYQHVTGDTIKPPANILGGALFGGPLGAVGGIAMTVVSETMAEKKDDTQELAITNNAIVALADLRQGLTPYNS